MCTYGNIYIHIHNHIYDYIHTNIDVCMYIDKCITSLSVYIYLWFAFTSIVTVSFPAAAIFCTFNHNNCLHICKNVPDVSASENKTNAFTLTSKSNISNTCTYPLTPTLTPYVLHLTEGAEKRVNDTIRTSPFVTTWRNRASRVTPTSATTTMTTTMTSSTTPSGGAVESDYLRYLRNPVDASVTEHEYFLHAKADLDKRHHEKVTKVRMEERGKWEMNACRAIVQCGLIYGATIAAHCHPLWSIMI